MSIKHAAAPMCAVTAIIVLVVSHGQVRTNTDGLKLIGNAEGCLREPYRCPAGRLTDGIGNTHSVKPGTYKTDQQIAADWQRNILDAEHCINTYFRGYEMPDNTFSAMTSAAFTTGCYGLRTYKGKDNQRHETTLHKLAQKGKWREMCERLSEFNNGGKYPGLTKRREAERQLCLKSV
ncbi:Phage lysozyme [Sodalis glossinidius str. 'morsitans']|uniref:Lysozyme n=1 Tax=Sodalis glossinidius (strain morsitans) TaxID=343509 RepID=Q2NSC9_SODGM|nr:lysozyme [Sodalis glossinidius]BAE74946.1 phage lysozyme lysis protein [Sodalis glossinidius str. 'morsitans']CRL45816.1 Phage lysozyme [Sodalis glossinidius str. 'morsitans']